MGPHCSHTTLMVFDSHLPQAPAQFLSDDICLTVILGTSIGVYALMTPENVKNEVSPYTWTCQVNSIITSPVVLLLLAAPTIVRICFQDNLPDGENQMAFMLLDPSATTQILFDYLEYQPTAVLTTPGPQSHSFIGISADDPGITYSLNTWFNMTDNVFGSVPGRESNSDNAFVEYNFTGVYI